MNTIQQATAPKPRRAFSRPLISQKIRVFPCLESASRYTLERLQANASYRFSIQQTTANQWAVCRVIAGGVA